MPVNDAKYIKEVWAENLEEEMAHLRDLVEEYPYLAMVRYEQTEDSYVLVRLNTSFNRTPSFLVWLQDLLARSKPRQTITIKL